MHHFEGENAKIFLGRGPLPHWVGGYPSPDPIPVDAFGVSIRMPSALDPQTTFLDTGLDVIRGQVCVAQKMFSFTNR